MSKLMISRLEDKFINLSMEDRCVSASLKLVEGEIELNEIYKLKEFVDYSLSRALRSNQSI